MFDSGEFFYQDVLFLLTAIGSEDRIFLSSSAKDPEANGAIPNSASERKKKQKNH